MKTTRIDLMEEYILEKHSVSIEEICNHFSISKSTARRNLDELVKRGKTKKVYGGICALDSPDSVMPLLSFKERDIVNQEEKKHICKTAASLVEPFDIIYIDTGTTCINMIDYIKDIPCTVITNSLNVSLKSIPYPDIDIIIIPGHLNRKTGSFTGHDIESFLRTVNIKKAFMATTGVSIQGGLTNAAVDEYTVKKNICNNSQTIYLLADHDKFDRTALYTYCELDKINTLITDRCPEENYVNFCQNHNIQLIY
ncbi:MAG: DeoR/GlpR family DNA-binding transcription regulator [Blautia sp.]|nr:DeoR/GlpR family DNA-binding transcription regulator [Blautia sp.]